MKTTTDYEREGYAARTWYLASCPYVQPKIRDAWQRGAWQWQQEQRARKGAPCCPDCRRPTEWLALSGGDRIEALCDACAEVKASYVHDDGRDLSELTDGEA